MVNLKQPATILKSTPKMALPSKKEETPATLYVNDIEN